jgi:hypothetical protein
VLEREREEAHAHWLSLLDSAEEAQENRVGVLLRVINAYYPTNPGGR